MLNKVYILYDLIFNRFKFQLHGESLKVFPPDDLQNEYKIFAKKFITENKNFIVSVFKQNKNFLEILHFDLGNIFFPLAFSQERLWFIENYEEGTNAYNLPLVFKQCAGVEVDILEKSIRGIISRHEILRTLIKTDNEGNRYQLVLKDNLLQLEISRIKVTSQSELNRELNILVNHIYDLTNEPPIKVCMYEISDHGENTNGSEYYLGIVVHHIAFDGWSIEIFLNELAAFYNYFLKLSTGAEARLDLPELSIQYKDFALWQRSYLSGEKLEKQLDYWQSKIEGYEALNIATDMPRPRQIDYSGEDIYFELDEARSNSLRELAKELKVSLYSLLLAGYYLMLRAYSQQDDIVIGTPVANRHYNNVENLIGFFVNSLALRVQIDSNLSLVEFIQYVSHEVMEAQLHQDLPFEKLVEKLNLAKDTSRHPIFQVMFGVHDFGSKIHNKKSNSGEVGLNDILEIYATKDSVVKAAQFDISTFIDDSHVTLKGSFNYATKIYTRVTIENLIATYTEILGQFVELTHDFQRQANTKIRDLRHLSKEQYKKVIVDWNRTDRPYSSDKTIDKIFEEQAEKTPDSVAVILGDNKLTYKELNTRANSLVRYLLTIHKVKSEAFIVLCLDRSEHMIIAILAVLKAGGTYVPIDHAYPDERIKYVLEDTATTLVLTNTAYKQRLDSISENVTTGSVIQILDIDNSKLRSQILEVQNSLNNEITSNNLAYAIYTSGTTGSPKGVTITHRGIVNRIQWMNNRYPISKNDKILQKTPYTFDVSVWEILWSIWYGGTVVFAKPEGHKDINYILDLINKESITIVHFVPSMLDVFINVIKMNKDKFSLVSNLKYIFCSGEALSLAQVKECHEILPNTEIHNLYGPTEASIDVLNYDCSNTKNLNLICLGKQIDNTIAYVLDKYLNPVPIGAIGELYVGGVGLARGYLNRPSLTAEKFIASPFNNKKGKKFDQDGRIYKTGDLARWLPDGNLEYIGRNDFQVKVRGYRIELTEIESILLSYPGLKQTVIVPKEHVLLGYYVAEYQLDEGSILNYLRSKLPEYMVPNRLIYLEELPLTVHGKLDRKALFEPKLSYRDSHVSPRNETERKICQIWAEVLNFPENKISVDDNFFRLGGHSLLATQLSYKLKQKLNISVPLNEFFSHPTIENLALIVQKSCKAEISFTSLINQVKKDIESAKKVHYECSKFPKRKKTHATLLTGANGFLGVHLLDELIKKSDTKVYCLIRADTEQEALQRLSNNLSYYGLDYLKNEPRIIPITGDLAKPQLGLEDKLFENLSLDVDSIYHNGAFVHHIYDYSMLRAANVLSTVELLKLAARYRPKHLNFISTLSAVFDHDQKTKMLLENFPCDLPQGNEGGYVISKWASEKILFDAQKKGFNITIYRLPQIMGNSITGVSPIQNNHLMLLIIGCIAMNIAPKNLGYLNMLPVDFVVRVIVDSSLTNEYKNKVFNLSNPAPIMMDKLFKWIKEFGCDLALIPYNEWQKALCQLSEANHFYPLLSLYMANPVELTKENKERCTFQSHNLQKFLSDNNIECPEIDRSQFLIYFKFIKSWIENSQNN